MDENNSVIKRWKDLDIRIRIGFVIGIIGLVLFILIPAVLWLLEIIFPDVCKFDNKLEYIVSGVSGLVGIASLLLAIISMRICDKQNTNTTHILNQHSSQLTETLSDIRILITAIEKVDRNITNVSETQSTKNVGLQKGPANDER